MLGRIALLHVAQARFRLVQLQLQRAGAAARHAAAGDGRDLAAQANDVGVVGCVDPGDPRELVLQLGQLVGGNRGAARDLRVLPGEEDALIAQVRDLELQAVEIALGPFDRTQGRVHLVRQAALVTLLEDL